MAKVEFFPTRCAICGTLDNSREIFAANFTEDAFNREIFSARRLPDRIHYRMVRCNTCDLLRSDPVASAETLAQLYKESSFSYGDETSGLRRTYGKYLDKMRACKIANKAGEVNTLLEIGCGNGFFLDEALPASK